MYGDYYQAGKSVAGIERVESVAEIVGRFTAAAAGGAQAAVRR